MSKGGWYYASNRIYLPQWATRLDYTMSQSLPSRQAAELLHEAVKTKELPPICSEKESWHDRKYLNYCDGRTHCPYA